MTQTDSPQLSISVCAVNIFCSILAFASLKTPQNRYSRDLSYLHVYLSLYTFYLGIVLSVRGATGIGIVVGFGLGWLAFGNLSVEIQTRIAAYNLAGLIIVLSTIIPLANYLNNGKAVISGPRGGFINGLGTGLGFYLLLVGRIV